MSEKSYENGGPEKTILKKLAAAAIGAVAIVLACRFVDELNESTGGPTFEQPFIHRS